MLHRKKDFRSISSLSPVLHLSRWSKPSVSRVHSLSLRGETPRIERKTSPQHTPTPSASIGSAKSSVFSVPYRKDFNRISSFTSQIWFLYQEESMGSCMNSRKRWMNCWTDG